MTEQRIGPTFELCSECGAQSDGYGYFIHYDTCPFAPKGKRAKAEPVIVTSVPCLCEPPDPDCPVHGRGAPPPESLVDTPRFPGLLTKLDAFALHSDDATDRATFAQAAEAIRMLQVPLGEDTNIPHPSGLPTATGFAWCKRRHPPADRNCEGNDGSGQRQQEAESYRSAWVAVGAEREALRLRCAELENKLDGARMTWWTPESVGKAITPLKARIKQLEDANQQISERVNGRHAGTTRVIMEMREILAALSSSETAQSEPAGKEPT